MVGFHIKGTIFFGPSAVPILQRGCLKRRAHYSGNEKLTVSVECKCALFAVAAADGSVGERMGGRRERRSCASTSPYRYD